MKNVFYLKATLESAGGLLYRSHKLLNRPYDNAATDSYNLFGIRYAHFQKVTSDLRYYIPIGLKSKLVYRLAGGVGVPRENLQEALPFEKSFFYFITSLQKLISISNLKSDLNDKKLLGAQF